MVMYTIIFSHKAQKHKTLLAHAKLEHKTKRILNILQENPFQTPPPYEKLVGDLAGSYSRRINRQHRIVYQVKETTKEIFILSMWTHYED